MRVIAATIVLLAHFTGNIGISGVGLFFVITGFLSGSKIRRAIANGEQLNFWKDLTNSIWRIFLPMYLILLAIFAWVATSVDVLHRAEWLRSIFAMALGYGNFYELNIATSYWDLSTLSSPTLHLWAMSVLIQFAFVLALFRYVIPRSASKVAPQTRKNLLIGFGILIGALIVFDSMNFDWSTSYHFTTVNWIWAFALGLILGGANWTLPNKSSFRLTADILFFGLIALALLPLFGINPLGNWVRMAAAVLAIVCLTSPETITTNFQKLLNSKPFQFLGNLSYEIYLVHWPLLIAYKYYAQMQEERTPQGLMEGNSDSTIGQLGVLPGLVLTVATVLLAWLLNKLVVFVSKSVDSFSEIKRKIIQVLAVASLPALIFVGQGSISQASDDIYKDLVPALEQSSRDLPSYGSENCETGIVKVCIHGIENKEKTVVIVGTSTAGQWFDAVIPTADKYGWQLQSMVKEGCNRPIGRYVGFCEEWRNEIVNLVIEQKPDLVILETSHASEDMSREEFSDYDQEFIKPFAQAGIKVLGIRGTPRFDFYAPECIARNSNFRNDCVKQASDFFLSKDQYLSQIDQSQFVGLIDMTDVICPNGVCTIVDGNIIKYVDDKHFTKTYSTTLSDELEPYLIRAIS